MMYNRRCLDGDHPEHPYNWVLRTFEGLVRPEEFGIDRSLDWRRERPLPSPFDPNY